MKLAKVTKFHPSGYSADVVFLDDGVPASNVQVLSPAASTNSGFNDMAAPDAAPGGEFSLLDSRSRDVIAVVGFVYGGPVIFGFLFPQVCQMLFDRQNFRVDRHASDVYTAIDGDGNTEVFHPSGTYLRIGTSPAHEDLTGKDFDGKWKIEKNTGKAVHVQLTVKNAGAQVASLNIDPAGNVTLAHDGALSIASGSTATLTAGGAVTVNAPSVTLNTPETTCTGNLTVNKGLSVLGSGVAGDATAIAGTMRVTGGDVVADSVSLKGHVHPENDGGGPTGAPVP